MATQTAESIVPARAHSAWTVEKARALYNVEGWGAGFFDIDERGHVVVRPDKEHPERQLSLHDLANDLEEQGVALPVLLRFSDILRSRIEALSERFANGPVPRPGHWSGFCLVPHRMEFWHNMPSRLHERHVYEREQDGWRTEVLYP